MIYIYIFIRSYYTATLWMVSSGTGVPVVESGDEVVELVVSVDPSDSEISKTSPEPALVGDGLEVVSASATASATAISYA